MRTAILTLLLAFPCTNGRAEFILRQVKHPTDNAITPAGLSGSEKLYAVKSFDLYPVAGKQKNGTRLAAGPDLWAYYQQAHILSDRWVRIVRLSDNASGWIPGWIEKEAFKRVKPTHPPHLLTNALGRRSLEEALRDEPRLRLKEGKTAFLWQIPIFPPNSERELIEDPESRWVLVERWNSGPHWAASRLLNTVNGRVGWTLDFADSPFTLVTPAVGLQPLYKKQQIPNWVAFSAGPASSLVGEHFKALGVKEKNLKILPEDRIPERGIRKQISDWLSPRTKEKSRIFLYLSGSPAYPLEAIFSDLAELPAKEILVILSVPLSKPMPSIPRGISVLSATSKAGPLQRQTAIGMDVFTYEILKTFNSYNRLTTSSLYKEVRKQLKGRQEPQFKKGRWRAMQLR